MSRFSKSINTVRFNSFRLVPMIPTFTMRELHSRSADTTGDLILEVIQSLTLIDYGVIVNVYERGPDGEGMGDGVYADVRLLDGEFIANAKVLFPGCRSALIDAAPAAQDRRLVLGSKRDTAGISAMLSSPARPYSAETVKVLPLPYK